jgi:hypothetical protein
MAKKAQIVSSDYVEGRKFFVYYWNVLAKKVPTEITHIDPEKVMLELEAHSMTIAKKGLRQALADVVEMYVHHSDDAVRELDKRLRESRIITITELRVKYSKRLAKILKSGAPKNETDYYLLRSVADSDALDLAQRNEIWAMLSNFEVDKTRRPKP